MTGIYLAAAFAGGLGLLLLGLGCLTDGVRLAGGSVLKANLRAWAVTRWRAFETGFAIALLVPSSTASTRAAAGFVNSGLVKLENALWLTVGVSFGSVVTAWLVVSVGLSPHALTLGLALVFAGAAIRGGLRGRRAALGHALTGFGLLFVGVAVIADAFMTGAPAGLPALPFGFLGATLLFLLLGAGVAAMLRSASVAVAAAVVATAAGAVELGEAMAFVAGANLGPIVGALWVLAGGTAQARRVAVSHAGFHVLGTAVALVLLLVTTPFHQAMTGSVGAPILLAAYHLLFQALAALLLVPLLPLLVKVTAHRIERPQQRGFSPHLDESLLAVPDLAIDGLLREVRGLFEHGRGLAHLALRDRVVSELRLRQDAEELENRVGVLDHTAAELIAGEVPAELAPVLVELPRATDGLRRLLSEIGRFREITRIPETGLDPRIRIRLRQLELAVLHLIEGADALDVGFHAEGFVQEAEVARRHLHDMRQRCHAACASGDLHPTYSDPLCARLDALERMTSHATSVALGLDRVLAPVGEEESFEEPRRGWFRKVA